MPEISPKILALLNTMLQNADMGVRDPRIREVAKASIDNTASELEIVEQLARGLARRLKYNLDWIGEYQRSPADTLHKGTGDADDLATVAAACFKALGFPIKFRLSRSPGRPYFHHVYIVVGVPRHEPEQWVPVDLAAPREHLFNNEVAADERRDV